MNKPIIIHLAIVVLLTTGCAQMAERSYDEGKQFAGTKNEIRSVLGKTVSYKFGTYATMIIRYELDPESDRVQLQGIFNKEGTGFSDLHLKYFLISKDNKILKTITLKNIPGIMHGETFEFTTVFSNNPEYKYSSVSINAAWY